MRILVLCTGNSCRSQMAHGYLQHQLGPDHEVHSAGLNPKGVHPFAVSVMNERGIDISEHHSSHVSDYAGQPFDYVITVCDNAKERCPIFPAETEMIHWSFLDPAAAEGNEEQRLGVFREVRDQIFARIDRWLAELD